MSKEGERQSVLRTTKVRTALKGDNSWIQRREQENLEKDEEEKPWVAEVRANRSNGVFEETSPVSSPTTNVPQPISDTEKPKTPASGYLIRGVFKKTDSKPTSTSNSSTNGYAGINSFKKKPSETYKKIAPHTIRSSNEKTVQSEPTLSPDEMEKRTEAASSVLKGSAANRRSYVMSAAKKYESSEKPDSSAEMGISFVAKRVDISDDDDTTASVKSVPVQSVKSNTEPVVKEVKPAAPEIKSQPKPVTETKPTTQTKITAEAIATPESKPALENTTQPKTASEPKPALQPKPATETTTVAETKPTAQTKTVTEPKPATEPKAAETKPAIETKTETKPAAQTRIATEPKPTSEPKPAETKPTATEPKPTSEPKPAETKPTATEPKPTSEPKPAETKPTATEPKTTSEPKPAETKPTTKTEPKPAIETKTKTETKPATQTTTATESKLVVETKPTTQTTTATDPKPTSEPKPAETKPTTKIEPKPAIETKTVTDTKTETKPTTQTTATESKLEVETKSTIKTTILSDPKPTSEPKALEPKPAKAVEPKPATETKPAAEIKPTTQTTPATDPKPTSEPKPVTETKPKPEAKSAAQLKAAPESKPEPVPEKSLSDTLISFSTEPASSLPQTNKTNKPLDLLADDLIPFSTPTTRTSTDYTYSRKTLIEDFKSSGPADSGVDLLSQDLLTDNSSLPQTNKTNKPLDLLADDLIPFSTPTTRTSTDYTYSRKTLIEDFKSSDDDFDPIPISSEPTKSLEWYSPPKPDSSSTDTFSHFQHPVDLVADVPPDVLVSLAEDVIPIDTKSDWKKDMDSYKTITKTVESSVQENLPESEPKKNFVYVKEYVDNSCLDGSSSDYVSSTTSNYSYSSPSYYSRREMTPCTYCGEMVGNDAKITIEHLNISCHPSCFKCGICSKPMGDLLYNMFLHRGTVHCESCYSNVL
ncbi:proteoglycan 4-like isoform X2 [Cyprinus carpio]|uniref:Proteoglycan 4-like isoform X2 n=1 Tax=Cyprinus carpio TaxID=7962 RepID=A0A9Q9X1Y5_CYPCA|nr:proteoglycan 4-like isoform X2 [Cyprinus carpio]